MNGNGKLRRFNRIDELIGNSECPTPLVRLNKVLGVTDVDVFLKLEWLSPFGSIKDRTAKYLIQGLLDRGELEGKELLEPSSGNTGIALAAIGNLLGVNTTVTIPDAVPEEKQVLLRLLGATVWPTPDDVCPIDHPKDGAIALAHAMMAGEKEKEKYVMPNQYQNPDNVRAHYETTGPEIWNQTEGKIRYFFAGYGTCGTISGVGKFLKEKDASIKVIAIEPEKGHKLPGMKSFKEAKKPSILDEKVIDETIVIPDEEAYRMTIRLAREEGLMVGPSTGAIVCAAQKYLGEIDGPAVAISPDNAFKYISYLLELVGKDGKPDLFE